MYKICSKNNINQIQKYLNTLPFLFFTSRKEQFYNKAKMKNLSVLGLNAEKI